MRRHTEHKTPRAAIKTTTARAGVQRLANEYADRLARDLDDNWRTFHLSSYSRQTETEQRAQWASNQGRLTARSARTAAHWGRVALSHDGAIAADVVSVTTYRVGRTSYRDSTIIVGAKTRVARISTSGGEPARVWLSVDRRGDSHTDREIADLPSTPAAALVEFQNDQRTRLADRMEDLKNAGLKMADALHDVTRADAFTVDASGALSTNDDATEQRETL